MFFFVGEARFRFFGAPSSPLSSSNASLSYSLTSSSNSSLSESSLALERFEPFFGVLPADFLGVGFADDVDVAGRDVETIVQAVVVVV